MLISEQIKKNEIMMILNNKRNNIKYRIIYQLVALMLVIIFLQACETKSQLIKDMDALYMKPERVSSKDRDNVSEVVQKYFPSGMKLSEALKYLDEQGFEIFEYQQNGFRKWPNGELRPYKDKSHKTSNTEQRIKFSYFAKNIYGSMGILVEKHARININSDDGEKVIKSYGHIVLYGM